MFTAQAESKRKDSSPIEQIGRRMVNTIKECNTSPLVQILVQDGSRNLHRLSWHLDMWKYLSFLNFLSFQTHDVEEST